MKKIIVIIALLLNLFSANAFSVTCPSDNNVALFFGNGMFNDEDDAEDALSNLRGRISSTLPTNSEYKISYAVSYNHNENGILQLVEVAVQQKIDNWSSFWNFLGDIEIAPDWFQNAMKDLATKVDAFNYVIDGDLQTHVQKYRSEILEGKKVLVVSHSQGNFYANRAYNLVNSQSFGIVAVGTPANFVAGSGPYTTLTNDVIINTVRMLVDPATLPGNATNATDNDWKHHSFIDAYLYGNVSGPRILSQVLTRIQNISQPTQTAETGIITVTLEWGSQPDVDLHIYEPNGTHVYWANSYGPSGYIDVDDTNGYGPEHYYVSCEKLQEGPYNVGVNYYWGYGPETARIQVSAGDIVRSYTTYLPQYRAGSGDSSPVPVASIQVSKDQDGKYQFDVVGY